MSKFWRTAISKVEPSKILIRGYRIEDLIGNYSFAETVYLLFTGKLPNEAEGHIMDAMLTSCVDHSLASPSTDVLRFVAASGTTLQASIAAGILTFGKYHAASLEPCAKMLQDGVKTINEKPDINAEEMAKRIVQEHLDNKKRVIGYGHAVHKDDPRTTKLLQLTKELGLAKDHVELAEAIEIELERQVGKKLILNVDGTIAAIISDIGIDWRLATAFFIMSRIPGLAAHYFEQITMERPYKSVPLEEISYEGPSERDIPKRNVSE
ncbi:MAG: citryl-CoA lyase [Promethearchaeota archaeon]